MTNSLKARRSELLTLAFVAQMLASPLADRYPHIGGMLALTLLASLLIGASYMANMRIVRRLVVPAAAIWLVARTLEAFGGRSRMYANLAPLAGLALSCAILWALLDRFHTSPRISSSVISEAFVSYLVISIAFSQVYWILSQVVENPFNQVIARTQTSTFLYFSMITLSSVGMAASCR